MQDGLSLPEWRGNTKNMDAQAAVLLGQVMTAVQLSGYNLVPPPGARGASKDWVRDGVRMQRWVVVLVGVRYLPHACHFDPGSHVCGVFEDLCSSEIPSKDNIVTFSYWSSRFTVLLRVFHHALLLTLAHMISLFVRFIAIHGQYALFRVPRTPCSGQSLLV